MVDVIYFICHVFYLFWIFPKDSVQCSKSKMDLFGGGGLREGGGVLKELNGAFTPLLCLLTLTSKGRKMDSV